MTNDNHFYETVEKRAKEREERKRKEKEMKTSGRSVFDLQKKIISEKIEKSQ